MTIPTRLTILRILLTFLIMALLFSSWPWAKTAALAGFLLASATDWLDGYLARRWHQTSPLGALLDPIADKVLVLGMFLVFVQLGILRAWLVLIIVFRELVITGIRLVAASRGVVLSAAREGKHKLVSQVVAILVVLASLVLRERGIDGPIQQAMPRLILGSLWLAMGLTVFSGVTFFVSNWTILRAAGGSGPPPRDR